MLHMECLDDYLVALYRKVDIMEMPKPEAATRNISTISRFLLKYWATISVEVSRVRPTPRPKGQTNIIKPKGKHQKEGYPWVPVLMPLFFKNKEEPPY